MTYGFQKGDPNFWRSRSNSSSKDQQVFNEFAQLATKKAGRPECAICMDGYREADLVSPLPCHVNHLFHTACIRPWLL